MPLWFTIAIIAQVFWVAGNLFDKFLLKRYFSDDDEQGPVVLLMFSAFFAAVVALFIYVIKFNLIDFSLASGLFGTFIGLLNATWIFFYLQAIDRTELSRAVPIFQTIPIFGLIFAYVLLGEVISVRQMLWAGLVVLGAVVVMHDRKHSFFGIDVISLVYMLAASIVVALTETLFKVASIDTNYWTGAFWLSFGFALSGVFLYIFVEKYQLHFNEFISRRKEGIFSANTFNEILDNLGELIFLAAVILGPVALVQSVNAYQPFLILFAGLWAGMLIPKYFSAETKLEALPKKFFAIMIITVGSYYLLQSL